MPETRLQAHASALVTRHKPRLTPIMQNRDAHLYATYTVLKSTIKRKELPDYKPVFVPVRATVIPLGPPLLTGSSDLPGSQCGASSSFSPIWSCSAWGLPCRLDYSSRGALLPHHFTLTPPYWARRYIFCGTCRIPSRTPAVSRHAALWRPDFPPPFSEATVHPAAPKNDYLTPRRLCTKARENRTNSVQLLRKCDISGVK